MKTRALVPILIAVFCITSAVAVTQVAGPQGGVPKLDTPDVNPNHAIAAKKLQAALKAANPDPTQAKTIRGSTKVYMDAIKALREDVKAGKTKRREAVSKIRAATEILKRNIKDTLSAEQFATFEAAMRGDKT